MKMRNAYILISLLSFAGNTRAQQTFTEEQKIDHLIAYIRNSKDITFIRNGSEYSSNLAADHLRMKWDKTGSGIKTAEDFIAKIATKSSITGELYKVRFKDGKEFNCELILKLELKRLMDGKVKLLAP